MDLNGLHNCENGDQRVEISIWSGTLHSSWIWKNKSMDIAEEQGGEALTRGQKI